MDLLPQHQAFEEALHAKHESFLVKLTTSYGLHTYRLNLDRLTPHTVSLLRLSLSFQVPEVPVEFANLMVSSVVQLITYGHS